MTISLQNRFLRSLELDDNIFSQPFDTQKFDFFFFTHQSRLVLFIPLSVVFTCCLHVCNSSDISIYGNGVSVE